MTYLIKKISMGVIMGGILLINLTSGMGQTQNIVEKPEFYRSSEENNLISNQQSTLDIERYDPTLSSQEVFEGSLPIPLSKQIKKSPYKELLNINDDYVAWIWINGTQVDYPIVKGSDNDFYLNRQFDKSYHKSGSIFMDYRNFGFGYNTNTVIYGHNMKDGTMFGSLKNFKDPSFSNNNNLITIEDLYGKRTYEIFSSYFAEADSSLVQLDINDDDYDNYIETLLKSSQYDYQLKPQSNQPILTLITCSYEVDDGRYFIHAKEVTYRKN